MFSGWNFFIQDSIWLNSSQTKHLDQAGHLKDAFLVTDKHVFTGHLVACYVCLFVRTTYSSLTHAINAFNRNNLVFVITRKSSLLTSVTYPCVAHLIKTGLLHEDWAISVSMCSISSLNFPIGLELDIQLPHSIHSSG